MRAMSFVAPGQPLREVEIERPVAGPGELLLEVRA
jgi:NADPH:quinone reductase-like Zn-dependent oxidoreductase